MASPSSESEVRQLGDLLVVGLGNPGDQYASTRHNLGVWVIDELVSRFGGRLKPSKHEHALVDSLVVDGRRMTLAFPATYMNESGRSVAQLVKRRGIDDLSRLLVVHDELDLPVGRMKLKLGGGLAGNNGLKSIKSHLHTADFARVRVGVGKPPSGRMSGADYVLRAPSKADRTELDQMVIAAADAVEMVLAEGIAPAMNKYNSL